MESLERVATGGGYQGEFLWLGCPQFLLASFTTLYKVLHFSSQFGKIEVLSQLVNGGMDTHMAPSCVGHFYNFLLHALQDTQDANSLVDGFGW